MIAALAVLTVALAGPMAEARVPRNRATIVLAIDVSLSMQATDVEPTRLAAAQAAANQFADQLPRASTWAWSPSPAPRRCWCRRRRTATR